MPSNWITLALFLAVPLILQLRGYKIVGLALGVALLFGVSVVIYVLTQILPPAPLGWLLEVLATYEMRGRVLGQTYYIIQNYGAAVAPAGLYSAIAFVFWVLYRWSAPVSQRFTTSLFWLLHLSVLAGLSLSLWISGPGMPRRYIDYDDAFQQYALARSFAETLTLIAFAGLVLSAIWSLVQRLRPNAL